MQKTFNVWVKNYKATYFSVCSKRIECEDSKNLRNVQSSQTDTIDCGSQIVACDVSQWLETLNMEEGEVREAQVTFKFK